MSRAIFSALRPRQQMFLMVAAGVACLALLLLLVVPLHARLDAARQDREAAHSTLGQITALSERYEALRRSGVAAADISLTAIVDETLQQHALQPASLQQNGTNELSLRVDTESFDKALGWISELEKRPGVLLRTVNVRPLGGGRVSVNLTLQQP